MFSSHISVHRRMKISFYSKTILYLFGVVTLHPNSNVFPVLILVLADLVELILFKTRY